MMMEKTDGWGGVEVTGTFGRGLISRWIWSKGYKASAVCEMVAARAAAV